MYKILIRPLLFMFPPETIHHAVIFVLKALHYIPGKKALLRLFFMSGNEQLKRSVFGLEFKNPVGLAAGFDKNAEVFQVMGSFGFSFVEIGTVTPLGQAGNPKPRLFRLKQDKALINRMGFNNKGLDKAVHQLKKRKRGIIIGGNIGKNTLTPNEKATEDYIKCFEALHPHVDYFTVNVSCPNISDLRKLQDRDALLQILSTLKLLNAEKPQPKPILLKISPDLTIPQLDDTIEIVKLTGIDGIVATNTSITRTGLKTDKQTLKTIGNGGLSGQPLINRTVEFISYIKEKTEGKLPIIGVGGIFRAEDAIAMLDAGASLVQVYTGFIYEGPGIVKKINKAILKKENK